MNFGISPDQAGKIVDRLAKSGNNPITAPSEATMPSNGQFFRISQVSAPVDFMSDPRYQPIQSNQPYSPSNVDMSAFQDQNAFLSAANSVSQLLKQK